MVSVTFLCGVGRIFRSGHRSPGPQRSGRANKPGYQRGKSGRIARCVVRVNTAGPPPHLETVRVASITRPIEGEVVPVNASEYQRQLAAREAELNQLRAQASSLEE